MKAAINWAAALALSIVILAPTAARAEAALILHGVSHHLDKRQHPDGRDWNERNTGAGLRWEFTPQAAAQVGFYANSMDRQSAYVLGDFTPWQIGPVRVGGFAGVVTGYTMPIMPMAGAVALIGAGRWHLALRAAPKGTRNGSAVVALEVGVKL